MTNKIIVASFGDGDASRDAVALGVTLPRAVAEREAAAHDAVSASHA